MHEDYAIQKHGSQKYGDQPYYVHLDHVYSTAVRFYPGALPDRIKIAAYLHDVIEDTDATFEEVSTLFGEDVAGIVDAVTDKPGQNRAERHRATYPLIRENPDAVFVKVCDRIANMESSVVSNPRLFSMYVREYPYFRSTLYRASEFDAAWEHLDGIADFFVGASPSPV
jgi:(p)ppGpp synthase/HD superfamily hydrolase